MSLLVLDKWLERRLRAQRKAWGADQHDEVWEGVYVMSPLADNEHQALVMGLAAAFHEAIGKSKLGRVLPGANVSDRVERWKHNYRAPDVVVILRGSAAQNCGTHWVGPVDFLIEIVSPGDRNHRKLPFYSGIGVRELLFVERHPWRLRLYRHTGQALESVGDSEVDSAAPLASEVIPFSFRLVPAEERPALLLTHTSDGRTWQA